ncbi:hypothetical protein [Candidatus Tisiphia endosymbiont of Nemotelus uliginosus]|uniref:hypothetical protein n=1 Tax=Candidatus Tisiphia endosymbiont of Nemotelus uliginosus TaxID=3077926 RepID=UPI0035C89799
MSKDLKVLMQECKKQLTLNFSTTRTPLPPLVFSPKRKLSDEEGEPVQKKFKNDTVENDAPRSAKKLVCIDCDYTLTLKHLCNELEKQLLPYITKGNVIIVDGQVPDEDKHPDYDQNKVIKATKDLLNDQTNLLLRDPESLKKVVEDLLKVGHKIAIVTFSPYCEAIKVILEEGFGFSQDQLKDIRIISGYPEDGPNSADRKMGHIELAKQITNTPNNKDVVLVDDDYRNIEKAIKLECHTIWVRDKIDWNCIIDQVNTMMGLECTEMKQDSNAIIADHADLSETWDYRTNSVDEISNGILIREESATYVIGDTEDGYLEGGS